jgi:hypothetical protein
MCKPEEIPPLDFVQRIRGRLDTAEEEADDLADLFTLSTASGTDDEILENVNQRIDRTDPDQLRFELINQGHVPLQYELPTDYENTFRIPHLSGRSQRLILSHQNVGEANIAVPERELMLEWAMMSFHEPQSEFDERTPADVTPFESIMLQSLPACLTVDTWISGLLLPKLGGALIGSKDEINQLKEWQPVYGDGICSLVMEPSGRAMPVVPFLGVASEGRLIWHRSEGFSESFFSIFYDQGDAVRCRLRKIEVALVALARRIARHVAWCIVYDYAAPAAERLGRAVLDRDQIGMAVKEILGDDCFDLPFDTDNSLRNWMIDDVLKPDAETAGWDVFKHEAESLYEYVEDDE